MRRRRSASRTSAGTTSLAVTAPTSSRAPSSILLAPQTSTRTWVSRLSANPPWLRERMRCVFMASLNAPWKMMTFSNGTNGRSMAAKCERTTAMVRRSTIFRCPCQWRKGNERFTLGAFGQRLTRRQAPGWSPLDRIALLSMRSRSTRPGSTAGDHSSNLSRTSFARNAFKGATESARLRDRRKSGRREGALQSPSEDAARPRRYTRAPAVCMRTHFPHGH